MTALLLDSMQISCVHTNKPSTSTTKKEPSKKDQRSKDHRSMWKKTFGQFRSQKHKPDNPHPDKYVKDMNEQELNDTLAFAKETENSELALKVYSFLFMATKDEEAIKKYKLDFADYNFSRQVYPQAAFAYEDFTIHYPGSEEFEYAFYKLIITNFYMTLTHDRDQSNTEKTISKTEEFLRIARKQQFIDEAQSILKQCRKKIFEHEVHVFENYMQQKKFTGAQKRLDFIKENFKDIAHINEYAQYLENFLTTMKNTKTRPFIVKVDLTQALPHKQNDQATRHNTSKTALYFVA